MKSAVAILTYRRIHALQAMLTGLNQHCAFYKTGIFEDCGQRDGTADVLQAGRTPVPQKHLMATQYVPPDEDKPGVFDPNTEVFMGDRNLGVAGNSNRALKWFMDSDCEHLCLCNDDLFVQGDFVKFYAKAHTDLNIGMFCFCDFTEASPAISGKPESYRWTVYPWRGYKLKFLPRFTGIMISLTRALVEKVGYFDAAFGQFGEEHSDYTIRCRFAGGIKMDGQDMNCLDVEHTLLKHQDVASSVQGMARAHADAQAVEIMRQCADGYKYRHYHRPFRLMQPKMVNGFTGGGMRATDLMNCGYQLVTDLV